MNTIKVLQELAALKQNEKKSSAQLHGLQEKKLRAILTYAYGHSQYYKDAFEAAGLTAETVRTAPLSAFPTLDKTTLLEQFDSLITVPDVTQEELRRFDAGEAADRKPYKGKYHVVHSSGSTGTPGYFLYDTAAWNSMLLGIIRGALWGMSMPPSITTFPAAMTFRTGPSLLLPRKLERYTTLTPTGSFSFIRTPVSPVSTRLWAILISRRTWLTL